MAANMLALGLLMLPADVLLNTPKDSNFWLRIGGTDLTDVAPRLGRFTKPVRLAWGTADRCFTPALGRRVADLFPDATFTEVPGARTFVALDDPQAVVDAIVAVNGVPAN